MGGRETFLVPLLQRVTLACFNEMAVWVWAAGTPQPSGPGQRVASTPVSARLLHLWG